MSTFEERKKGFEKEFAHDAEVRFRIIARRNRLAGMWVAEKMQLTEAEAEAYARSVIRADFEEAGDDDIVRKIRGDLLKTGIEISDIELRAMLDEKQEEARQQVENE